MHIPHFLLVSWYAFEKIGQKHGVNPVAFAILYAIHEPLTYGTLAWTIYCYRKGRDVSNLIVLTVFFLISPWFYPLLFGRNIPIYVYILGVAGLVFLTWHGYHKVHKRIGKEKAKIEAASEPATEETG